MAQSGISATEDEEEERTLENKRSLFPLDANFVLFCVF